jgi:translocator assembly and maintenance protein 41
MKINKKDYSYLMRFGGSEIVTNFNKRAAGLFFNPFVETDLGVLKYGVISTERAVDDLENWTSLYLSGRLHKPVKVIFELTYIFLSSQKLSEMTTLTKKIGQISPKLVKKRENVRKSFLK